MAASEGVMDRLSNEILLTVMEEVTTDSVNEFADTYAALSLCLVFKSGRYEDLIELGLPSSNEGGVEAGSYHLGSKDKVVI
jgi:hypothetical protein